MLPVMLGRGDRRPPRPAFVELHPLDDGSGLPPVFFEHPDHYTKHSSPDGRIDLWGLYEYEVAEAVHAGWILPFGETMQRQPRVQMLYKVRPQPSSESQFVSHLVKKKAALSEMDLEDFPRRDYILHNNISIPYITKEDGSRRVWRRFRVSGGLSLTLFADKFIDPLMGWSRGYHIHTFTDFSDGALFGPEERACVDLNLRQAGIDFLPEDDYILAHLVRSPGQRFGYLYDLGDRWQHEVLVEDILPTEASNCAIQVLSGSGAPIAEDIGGCAEWQEIAEEYAKSTTTPDEKFDLMHEAFHSFNYRERDWDPSGWSFDWFDISDARRAIKKALNSPTTTYGKRSVIGVSDCDRIVGKVMDPETGKIREVVSPVLDSVRRSACAQCGRPDGLKVCTGCRGRYYCSGSCQQHHWKEGHKHECKQLKEFGVIKIRVLRTYKVDLPFTAHFSHLT